jgi:hypothetical protein
MFRDPFGAALGACEQPSNFQLDRFKVLLAKHRK